MEERARDLCFAGDLEGLRVFVERVRGDRLVEDLEITHFFDAYGKNCLMWCVYVCVRACICVSVCASVRVRVGLCVQRSV